MDRDTEFELWYDMLVDLAAEHGESVADRDAWREEFEAGASTEDAFYNEYPEHR